MRKAIPGGKGRQTSRPLSAADDGSLVTTDVPFALHLAPGAGMEMPLWRLKTGAGMGKRASHISGVAKSLVAAPGLAQARLAPCA